MTPPRVLETSLYASDLPAAERFYTDVFGLEVVARWPGRGLALQCTGSVLLIFDPERTGTFDGHVPTHGTVGPGHVAFVAADAELPAWRARLAHLGVPIEMEVEWPEGGRSLYVRDPAGNSVELAPPALWRGAAAQPDRPTPSIFP
jgi:catechol 2,3-dioxygenase-like lactoylglutathione lyase family enzyme